MAGASSDHRSGVGHPPPSHSRRCAVPCRFPPYHPLTPNSIPESILALPNLGIQLSSTTHLAPPVRLHFVVPLTRSTRFIPLSALCGTSSVFLHEGVRRWSVEYYLGVLGRTGRGAGAGESMAAAAAAAALAPRDERLNEVHMVFPVCVASFQPVAARLTACVCSRSSVRASLSWKRSTTASERRCGTTTRTTGRDRRDETRALPVRPTCNTGHHRPLLHPNCHSSGRLDQANSIVAIPASATRGPSRWWESLGLDRTNAQAATHFSCPLLTTSSELVPSRDLLLQRQNGHIITREAPTRGDRHQRLADFGEPVDLRSAGCCWMVQLGGPQRGERSPGSRWFTRGSLPGIGARHRDV